MDFSIPTGALKQTLPLKDRWFQTLEKQMHKDLVMLPGNGCPPPIKAMKAHAAANPKFARSCLFVRFSNGQCTLTPPQAKPNERGFHSVDSRWETYARMLVDLGAWCTQHGLTLPETELAIYCCDTYAWEPEARAFPWLVMAKPLNRPGLLIPDDSFITHALGGNGALPQKTGHAEWAWAKALAAGKKIKGKTTGTDPVFYFKGARTGARKWDVRTTLERATAQDPTFKVDLSGTREPWPAWAKYGALLDLPGNQPWSYRRKFLHLLGRPIIQLDVRRFASAQDQDGSERWVQFYDCLLQPSKHYAPFSVDYMDDASAPPTVNVDALRATALNATSAGKFATAFTGRRVLSKLTPAHVLQYLYMLIWNYHLYFGGGKPT